MLSFKPSDMAVSWSEPAVLVLWMVSRTVWALTIHAITLATANIINCLNFIFMVN